MTAPGLEFRLSAINAEFNAQIAASSAVVGREVAKMNAAGQTFSRNFTSQIQQAGFQIGDFAVQVQNGTSPLVALTQQGSQLLGMFGPWGAVLGAAGAVAGALATALLGASDASKEADTALDSLQSAAGSVDGALGDLRDAAEAYVDAIAATGPAQSDATRSILADTAAEYAARKELLALRLEELRIAAEGARARQGAIEADIMNRPTLFNTTGMGPDSAAIYDRENQEAIEEYTARIKALVPELRSLNAELKQKDIQVKRGEELLRKPFGEIAADAKAARKKGGGGRKDKAGEAFGDAVTAAEEKIAAMQREREAVGLTANQQRVLTIEYEASRIEYELLQKAKETGAGVTAAEADLAKQVADAYRDAATATLEARAIQDAVNTAQKEAAEIAKEQARSVEQLANRFTSAVQSADSFGDALRNVGLEIANLAIQGLFGAGPAGSFFNSLLGVGAGGLFGFAGGLNPTGLGAGVTGTFPGRATGGPVMAGAPYMVGERGPEPFVPAVNGRILSVGQAQAALRGGGGGVNITVDARGSSDPAAIEAAGRRGALMALAQVPGITREQRRRGQL